MNSIMPTLGKTIDELGITKNKLAVESKIRPATIGDLVDGKARAIQFQTLTNILDALNRISFEQGNAKRYSIENVIVYANEKSPR